MDVVVGRVDTCLGDYWVTTERLGMGVEFMFPFGADDFYLIASTEGYPRLSFWDILAKPWEPFTPQLWLCVLGFIMFTSFVTLLTDGIWDIGDKYEDNEETDDFDNPTVVGMYMKAVYMNFVAFVSVSPVNTPTSVGGRLALVGFGWFLLITMASYTANLASILVADKAVGTINSIEDAINKRLNICVHPVMGPELKETFPNANFVDTETTKTFHGLYSKECDVALMTDLEYKFAMSGTYNEEDCKEGNEAGKEFCIRDSKGNPVPTRDCSKYHKVGNIVISVPVSIPVSKELVRSFSYTFRQLETDGRYTAIKNAEISRLAAVESACADGGGGGEDLRMTLTSMAGTFIISVAVQLIALALSFYEFWTGKTTQQMMGLYDHHLGQDGAPDPREHHEKSHPLTRIEFDKEMDDLKRLISEKGSGLGGVVKTTPAPSAPSAKAIIAGSGFPPNGHFPLNGPFLGFPH